MKASLLLTLLPFVRPRQSLRGRRGGSSTAYASRGEATISSSTDFIGGQMMVRPDDETGELEDTDALVSSSLTAPASSAPFALAAPIAPVNFNLTTPSDTPLTTDSPTTESLTTSAPASDNAPATLAPVTWAPFASPPVASVGEIDLTTPIPVPTTSIAPTLSPAQFSSPSASNAAPASLAPVTWAPFASPPVASVGEIDFTTPIPVPTTSIAPTLGPNQLSPSASNAAPASLAPVTWAPFASPPVASVGEIDFTTPIPVPTTSIAPTLAPNQFSPTTFTPA